MYKIVWKFQRINLLLIAEKIQIVVNYCAKCRIEKSCAKVLVFFFLWYNIVESTCNFDREQNFTKILHEKTTADRLI